MPVRRGHAHMKRRRPDGGGQRVGRLDDVAVKLAWLRYVADHIDPPGPELLQLSNVGPLAQDAPRHRSPVQERPRLQYGYIQQSIIRYRLREDGNAALEAADISY